jgi:hypothetical protein
MSSKLIFCLHGISDRGEIEVPFEFSSIKFYCDLGFRLIHPVNAVDQRILRPDKLTGTICKDKLIPRRIKGGQDVFVENMDAEINKLKYVPNQSTGKIKLNNMVFKVSLTDMSEPIFFQNFGLHLCKSTGESIKLMGIDDFYRILKDKARSLRRLINDTFFSYSDIFGFLRDAIARFDLDPSRTEICMFTCRGFEPGAPGQTPMALDVRRGGGFKDVHYDEMLFLENGVALVSQKVFHEYNVGEKYNPKFIPIANEVSKLILSSRFDNDLKLSKDKMFSERPLSVNIGYSVYGGKYKRNHKTHRSSLRKYRLRRRTKRERRKIKKRMK